LAKEPAARYASALALANDLARFLAGEPILARRPSFVSRWQRRLRRHWRAAAVTASVVVLLGLSLAGILHFRTPSRVAALQAQVLTELENIDGSADSIARVEVLIGELDTFDPAVATEQRKKLLARWTDVLKEQIRKSTFQEAADVTRLRSRIAL